MNRRSPFYMGLTGAAGVAVTFGLVELLIRSRSILIIIGSPCSSPAAWIPFVSWLTRAGGRAGGCRHGPYCLVGVIGIFLAPPSRRSPPRPRPWPKKVPTYLHQLQDHNSELGKLNQKYQIQSKLTSLLSTKGSR